MQMVTELSGKTRSLSVDRGRVIKGPSLEISAAFLIQMKSSGLKVKRQLCEKLQMCLNCLKRDPGRFLGGRLCLVRF